MVGRSRGQDRDAEVGGWGDREVPTETERRRGLREALWAEGVPLASERELPGAWGEGSGHGTRSLPGHAALDCSRSRRGFEQSRDTRDGGGHCQRLPEVQGRAGQRGRWVVTLNQH